MVREWVCVGSLTVVFFLRELCFGFLIAPCAFPRWTGHVVLVEFKKSVLRFKSEVTSDSLV
jgi:hypothetical protein